MSKILLYTGATTGVTTGLNQHAFFINENGIPAVKNGSQVITFGTSGYAMQGSSGSSGANGSSGASGTSGISGTSGQDGAPGDIGPGGTSGSSGESGTSGINGIDGATGISGTSGVDGTFFGSSGSSGANGSDGIGVPTGGTINQVLAKASSTNYDTQWVDQSGGGGLTMPMQKSMLPPIAGNVQYFTNVSWRTWVGTTSFGFSDLLINSTFAQYGIFAMGEGEVINQIQINVSAAAAGTTCWVAIYRIAKDATNNRMYLSDRLLDCGTVSSATTGAKTITLGTPFTMGAEAYGSVAIVVGTSAASGSALRISGWSSPVWDGNGGILDGGAFYRNIGLTVNGSLSTPPSEFTSTTTYSASTSSALYVAIR